MAKEETSEVAALLQSLPNAIAQATIELQKKTMPYEEREATKVSAFNPTGGERPKLTRKVYFCGHVEEEGSLTNEEIEQFNKIQPGDYHGGQWKVTQRKNGQLEELFIALPVSDPDQRMALPNKLSVLLNEIIAEQSARRK